MVFSFQALTCFPKTDPMTGHLIFEENREKLGLIENIVAVGLFGLLLYPAVLAIAAVGELYLAVNWLGHRYQNWSLGRVITQLESGSDALIERMMQEHLAGLEQRKQRERLDLFRVVNDACKDWPYLLCEAEHIKRNYETFRSRHPGDERNFQHQTTLDVLSRNVRVVRAYERTLEEIGLYRKFERTLEEIGLYRKLLQVDKNQLLTAYRCEQLHHQVAMSIDAHYLRQLLLVQIPVVGLLYAMHSTYTTKAALESTNLVEQYQQALTNHPWVQPYLES